MTVINPCDYNQTKAATLAIADYQGPVYLRFGRPKVPNFTTEETPFEIGKGILLNPGTDVTIIATGHLVWETLKPPNLLNKMEFLLKLSIFTPLSRWMKSSLSILYIKQAVLLRLKEHNYLGGLGESVAQHSRPLILFLKRWSLLKTLLVNRELQRN